MTQKQKELQEKRNQLAAAIRAHADKQATWNAEDKEKWAALNKEYDANMELLKQENQQVATAQAEADERTAMDKRLAEISGYRQIETPTSARDWRSFLGRDGGSLHAGPQNRNLFVLSMQSPQARQEFEKLQVKAMQAWMLAGNAENHYLITDEHIDAAKALGIPLGSGAGEINLRIGETARFNRCQAYYKQGTRSRGGSGNTLNVLGGREFFNDMREGQGSQGGFLMGETFLTRLEFSMLDYSGVLQVAEVLRTESGEIMSWPTMDDTANTGARVGESQDAGFSSPVDPKVGRLRLQAFTFHSNFLFVSRSLMMDSPLNLEEMFGGMLGTRIGRKQNVDFTGGADVGNGPIGIVTSAASGKTAASSTAIAFDETIDLVHSIDPARRRQPGNGYMMHDSILQVVRKIKNGIGDYIWSVGKDSQLPDLLNEYPYWINQSMDSTMASGKKTMLFGELPMYKVRQVNGIRLQRLVERRAEFDEDCFIAYLRADGGLLDPGDHPVKYLTHP